MVSKDNLTRRMCYIICCIDGLLCKFSKTCIKIILRLVQTVCLLSYYQAPQGHIRRGKSLAWTIFSSLLKILWNWRKVVLSWKAERMKVSTLLLLNLSRVSIMLFSNLMDLHWDIPLHVSLLLLSEICEEPYGDYENIFICRS